MPQKLQRIRSAISNLRPMDSTEYQLTVLALADKSNGNENDQLGVLVKPFIGKRELDPTYHQISGLFYKSKRPVLNLTAAETLPASEAIDEAKLVASVNNQLLDVAINV